MKITENKKSRTIIILLIIFSILCLLAIIGLAITAGLYIRGVARCKVKATTARDAAVLYKTELEKLKMSINASSAGLQACTTQECLVSMGEVVSRMDQTVDPCQDFYQYACGAYSRPEVRPSDLAVVQTFDLPYEATYQKLHVTLTSPGNTYKSAASTAIQKSKDFYKACLSDTADDSMAKSNFLSLISALGSWPVSALVGSRSWSPSTWNVQDALAATHGLKADSLVAVGTMTDPRNASSYILTVGAPTPLLGDPKYYASPSVESAYKEYVVKILTLIYGAGMETIYNDCANRIWSFEKSLSAIYPSAADVAASKTASSVVKLGVVQNKVTMLNLVQYLNKVFVSSGVTIDESTDVLVSTQGYLDSLNAALSALSGNSTDVIPAYIVWSAFHSLVPYSGKSFKDAYNKMLSIVVGKPTTTPVMWKSCLDRTTAALGFASGAAYVEKNVRDDDVKRIDQLLQLSKKQLLAELPKTAWIAGSDASTISQRAANLNWQIGTPNYLDSAQKLDQYYNGINVSASDYFRNILSQRIFEVQTSTLSYGKPIDQSLWIRPPTATYSYYNPYIDQVLIQAGLLHKPMYYTDFPMSFNYGGIGSILGQKITMLFGLNENWWQNETRNAYNAKAQCFIDQYSKETFSGLPVNGALTSVENIADTVGLRLAYNAYLEAAKGNSSLGNVKVPGFSLTAEQQYFLSFTQLGCMNYDPARVSEVTQPNHVPSPLRVKLLLVNSPEFSAAFKCPAGSGMNPSNRCTI